MIGPVIEAHILQLLGSHGLEFLIQSPSNPERPPSFVICRGKNRFVNELHIRTRAKLARVHSDPVCFTKGIILTKERMWTIFPACKSFKRKISFSNDLKIGHEIGAPFDQEERGTYGAVHWDTKKPKLLRAFRYQRARKFSDKEWLHHLYEGSNKTRFEYCESSKNSLVYIRANQGHTGVNMIALGLMGHVAIPHTWKEFVFH